MRIFILTALAVLFHSTGVWAGDASAPTALSNKAAIDLVQTNADYIWTLLAAALVFFYAGGVCLGGIRFYTR